MVYNVNYKFKIFVSYGQLREYLYILIENNLLEYIDGTQIQDYRKRTKLS